MEFGPELATEAREELGLTSTIDHPCVICDATATDDKKRGPSMQLPDDLVDNATPEQALAAEQWWEELSARTRADFSLMWDQRAEDSALYGFVDGDELVWRELPLELVGEFIEPDSAPFSHDELQQQLLEFVNNHEEIEFFIVERKFHICRAHAAARQIVVDGILPADFSCPLSSGDCPMRRLLELEPGKSLRFVVRPKRRA